MRVLIGAEIVLLAVYAALQLFILRAKWRMKKMVDMTQPPELTIKVEFGKASEGNLARRKP